MTILPKKKTSKEKNEGDNSDHAQLPHSPVSNEARVNPHPPTQRWNPPTSGDDRLTTHDPGRASGRYEDFAPRESASGQNKRRHRSSPHRNVRKHRHERHDRVWEGGSNSNHRLGHASFLSAPLAPPSEHTGDELEELAEGYNSEDEYPPTSSNDSEDIEALEAQFEKAILEKRKLTIKKMGEDGACLFRAVADQVYGDQEMHSIVRQNCADYMAKNADFFAQYVTEEFGTYLARKRQENCHGNHVEMQALCELYNRPIEVYQYSLDPINTFHGAYKTDNEAVRLSYHRNNHYNSLVNPFSATVGVGLGLPGFQPGQADKNLMRDAVKQSENHHIEQTMLEDKLRETDWEVTQETIEEQVARESYLQWLRDQEKLAKRQASPRSASATCSSASECPQNWWDSLSAAGPARSPEPRPSRSPRNRGSNSSSTQTATQNSPKTSGEGEHLSSPKATASHPAVPVGSIATSCASIFGDSSTMPPCPFPSENGMGAGPAHFRETASLMNDIPLQMYGISEWDEDDIMAQVIAQSQQEYLDKLRQNVAGGIPGTSYPKSKPAADKS